MTEEERAVRGFDLMVRKDLGSTPLSPEEETELADIKRELFEAAEKKRKEKEQS